MNKKYIDIGINLINKQFRNEIDQTIDRALDANVSKMILTGTSLKNSIQAHQLANKNPQIIYSTAGIHPHNAKTFTDTTQHELKKLLKNPNVVAVGECGLDFDRDFSPRPIQEKCFEMHLELAVEIQKPVFLHERAAHQNFNAIIDLYKDNLSNAIVHCFTGSLTEAKTFLDNGFYIGFTGAISDIRRFNQLKEVVRYAPLDRIMIETDCPFMLPKNIPNHLLNQKNKRRNEPAFVSYVAASIANFKNIPITEVMEATTENAIDFFELH